MREPVVVALLPTLGLRDDLGLPVSSLVGLVFANDQERMHDAGYPAQQRQQQIQQRLHGSATSHEHGERR